MLSNTAFAQNNRAEFVQQLKVEQLKKIQNLQQGSTFSSGQQSYVLLPEVRSVKNTQEQSLSRSGVDILETKGSFLIYKNIQNKTQRVTTEATQGYPVVFNTRTSNFAIVFGEIRMQLKNMNDAEAIASEYKLQITRKFSHLQHVFYRTPRPDDIFQVLKQTKKDDRIKNSSIEVLENLRTAL